MVALPPELLARVFWFLDTHDLVRVGCVCRRWREISGAHCWKDACLHAWFPAKIPRSVCTLPFVVEEPTDWKAIAMHGTEGTRTREKIRLVVYDDADADGEQPHLHRKNFVGKASYYESCTGEARLVTSMSLPFVKLITPATEHPTVFLCVLLGGKCNSVLAEWGTESIDDGPSTDYPVVTYGVDLPFPVVAYGAYMKLFRHERDARTLAPTDHFETVFRDETRQVIELKTHAPRWTYITPSHPVVARCLKRWIDEINREP